MKGLYPYFKNLQNIRGDMLLRTDILVGYPTSTVAEEKETLSYVFELFDEVAVYGFERFPHTRIERMGLPFYGDEEINRRVQYAVDYLSSKPDILVHRGGQLYHTLTAIERPKEELRIRKQVRYAK